MGCREASCRLWIARDSIILAALPGSPENETCDREAARRAIRCSYDLRRRRPDPVSIAVIPGAGSAVALRDAVFLEPGERAIPAVFRVGLPIVVGPEVGVEAMTRF